MAYCRWSDSSDVYVYANVTGCWTVHLAGRRRKKDAPKCPFKIGTTEYFSWQEEHESEVWTPVPEYNGQRDWDLAGPEECKDFLILLKNSGYIVPEYAILRLQSEIEEGNGPIDHTLHHS